MKCPKCKSDNPDTKEFCGDCGAKLVSARDIPASSTKSLVTPRAELTTGSVFAGRYQIVEELGEGGMGKVYKVIDKQLNEEVALKLIKPEIAADKKTIKRFGNELKLSRKISHRNVGRMYELMEDKGALFITMEYVPGQDLKGLIRQSGRLAIGTTISIAKQVCEGLTEAHRLGVIHRDLKPHNIMIDKRGNARIMDFGIARSLTAKSMTRAGAMIGTPEYMSPEQAEAEELDQRSDIYSLGVILYEMVTGQLPFEGDTPLSVAMKHKAETPTDPRELNPQIPGELSQLILKCMEKDKDSRYQDAEELSLELANIEMSIPTLERVIPRKKTQTSKEITVTFNLKKCFILALAAAALVIAVVITWPFLPHKESISLPPDTPSIAVLPFEDFSPTKDQEYFCESLKDSIILALMQARNLRVPATTSLFESQPRDYREIGQKLKVKTVLDGSVQKVEDEVRIIAKLIDIADGSIIWTGQFDPEQENIFSILDTISVTIVDRLKVNLLGGEETKIIKRYTENPEAWRLYSRGRYHWNKRTKDGFDTAIDYFNLAIRQDPSYALAHAGLADCYNCLGFYAHREPNEAFPEARKAASDALTIDSTLAEAHASLGYTATYYEWDWERAESEFKHAIDLNPNYATAHHWYAGFLNSMERYDESIVEWKQAQKLDPGSSIITMEVGWPYFFMRQYDEATKAFQNALLIDEKFWKARWGLAIIYSEKRMYDKALAEIQEAEALLKGWQPWTEYLRGIIYARMGKRGDAQQVIDHLLERSRQDHVPSTFFAELYFALQEDKQGFEWLDTAYEQRDPHLTGLRVIRFYDSVRSDPRFIAMLKKIGLDK
jgi:serine/threonine protein kinase/tetratricopeptide (TPR) repeat protein